MQLSRSLRARAATARPASKLSAPMQVRGVAARAATDELVATNGAAAANMVDFEELSDIIRMVNDTDIVELELKSKRFNLSVKKREALKAEQPMQVIHAPMMAAPAPAPAAPAGEGEGEGGAAGGEERPKKSFKDKYDQF